MDLNTNLAMYIGFEMTSEIHKLWMYVTQLVLFVPSLLSEL
jgi:hypothetical protein